MAGLMLSIFVAAIDSTVVGTALPTIARELGGFPLYPWIFAGYLLTGTTTVPIWGRLADLRGRRPVLIAGMGIFVAASLLCGAAPSMQALIAFRTLQGVGAGCLQPVTFTVVGDLFPLRQRARLQGFFSGMWAVAAIIGPLLGAGFVSTVGWRWVFVVNLPVGALAAALVWGLREPAEQRARGRLNPAGAVILTLGVGLLLWGLGAGGAGGQPTWPAVATGLGLLAAFGLLERRSASPTVPLHLLRHPVIGSAVLTMLLAGTVMWGVTAYVPLEVQGGLGGTAYQAGVALAPMSVGWPVASVLSGRLLLRAGHRPLVVAGALLMVAGGLLLAVPVGPIAPVRIGLASGVVGSGLGMLSTPILIAIQSSVGFSERGAATALNQFVRTIGGAVGVSLMGVLLAFRVRDAAARLGIDEALAANPLHPGGGGAGRLLVAGGVEAVFWSMVGLALATLAVAVLSLLVQGRGIAPAVPAEGPT